MAEEGYILKRIEELKPWIEGTECCDVCGISWKVKDNEAKPVKPMENKLPNNEN